MLLFDAQNQEPSTLQTLLDLSPLATATLDLDGKVTRWNAAAERLFDWTSDEVIGELHPMACAEADWLRQHCAIALHAERPTKVDARRPRRDGLLVSVSVSVAVTYDADRNPQGFVALYNEDKPEGRHERTPNGIELLASGIAVEINSPSQYISDNLSFLNDGYARITEMMTGIGRLRKLFADDSEPAAILTEVESFCRASEGADLEYLMAEIPTAIKQSIDGLRLVSRIVTAMREFSPQQRGARVPVNLNKAVETTMLVANSETRYVADIYTFLDPELPSVWCLPGPINQVVLTLLTNAAHAIGDAARTQPGIGRITVSTRKGGPWVELEVADTGTGIPASVQEHIFGPFLAGAGSDLDASHGLALAYATIVHQHRGRIWFETEAGKGSSFFVRLPLREPNAATVQEECDNPT